jgi:putative lipoic acid-binding regulatory protein
MNSAAVRSPLQFPCHFPIKAFGFADSDFDTLVVGLVRRHAPDLSEAAVTRRFSGKGKYLAVTINVRASSREQLDAIYRDLSACQRVLMAL